MKGLLVLIAVLFVLVELSTACDWYHTNDCVRRNVLPADIAKRELNTTEANTSNTTSKPVNCKEDNNEEYVLCTNCLDTCQKIVPKRPEQEFAGCACKQDFVLDEETNTCITLSKAAEKCHPAKTLEEESIKDNSSYPKHNENESSMPGDNNSSTQSLLLSGDNKSSSESSLTHGGNTSTESIIKSDNATHNGTTTIQEGSSSAHEKSTTANVSFEITSVTKPSKHHHMSTENTLESNNKSTNSSKDNITINTTNLVDESKATINGLGKSTLNPSTTESQISSKAVTGLSESTTSNSNKSHSTSSADEAASSSSAVEAASSSSESEATSSSNEMSSIKATGSSESTTFNSIESESTSSADESESPSSDIVLEEDISDNDESEQDPLSDSRRKRSLRKNKRVPDIEATGLKFQINDDIIVVPGKQ